MITLLASRDPMRGCHFYQWLILLLLILPINVLIAEELAPDASSADSELLEDKEAFDADSEGSEKKEPQSMTLADAIRQAIASHPQIGSARQGEQVAWYARREALSRYFPQGDLRATVGREQTDNPALRSNGTDDLTLTRRELNLTFRQLIFDGFETRNRVREQTALLAAARFNTGDAREAIAQRAVQAYLDVLLLKEQILLAEENVSNKESMLEKISLRERKGVGIKADEDQVHGRLSRARAILIGRRGNLRVVNAAFYEAVGKSPESLWLPQTPNDQLAPSLAIAQENASDNNPSIKSLKERVQAAQAVFNGSRSRFVPVVNLELNANRNRNLDGITGDNEDQSAMFVLNYSFFRGGADFANLRRAKAQMRQTQLTLSTQKRIVKRNVAVSWSDLETAREVLPSLKENVNRDRRVLEAFIKQFGLGRRTLFDLLDAEDSLFASESAELTGEYNIYQAVYSVFASTGQLVETILSNFDEEESSEDEELISSQEDESPVLEDETVSEEQSPSADDELSPSEDDDDPESDDEDLLLEEIDE